MTKERLSNIQLSMLFAGFLYGSSSLLNPASSALQDGWLAFIFGWMLGFILIGIYVLIYLLNPSLTLIGIVRRNFGKIPGSAIGALYAWYFLHLAAIVLRDFGEFSGLVMLPDTPMPFIIACFGLLCVYGLKKGIEVVARTSELLTPLVPLAFLAITIGVAGIMDFSNIQPVLAKGVKPVINAGFGVLTFPFGESIAFLMILPLARKRNSLMKAILLSTLLAGTLLLMVVLRDIFVLNPFFGQRAAFPAELASKLFPNINIYPLIYVNLMIGGGIKVTVCLYAAAAAVAELFGISDYKAFILPMTAFAVVLSIWLYDNVMQMFIFANKVYPYYVLPFQIILPLLLLLVSFIKKITRSKRLSSS